MFATKLITVIGAIFAMLLVSNVAAADGKRPPWETAACEGGEWTTFTPKAEGDLPVCPTKRSWKKCERAGYKPMYAHWCEPAPAVGKRPGGFDPG